MHHPEKLVSGFPLRAIQFSVYYPDCVAFLALGVTGFKIVSYQHCC